MPDLIKEEFHLPLPLSLVTCPAIPFPAGICSAFSRLQQLTGFCSTQDHFGLSFPSATEPVLYKVGFELEWRKQPGAGVEEFSLLEGRYRIIIIDNWIIKPASIRKAFSQLLSGSDIEPGYPSIEWYQGLESLLCMVRLKNIKSIFHP